MTRVAQLATAPAGSQYRRHRVPRILTGAGAGVLAAGALMAVVPTAGAAANAGFVHSLEGAQLPTVTIPPVAFGNHARSGPSAGQAHVAKGASDAPALSPVPPSLGTATVTFVVDTTTDTTSGTPGATCAPGNAATCSLRVAVEAADLLGAGNASAGLAGITVPSGTYGLSLGPLVVTDPAGLSINGAGAATTVLKTSHHQRLILEVPCTYGGLPVSGAFDPNCAGPSPQPRLTVSGITLTGGDSYGTYDTQYGGAIEEDTTTGLLLLTNSVVTSNTAARGGGLALYGDAWLSGDTVAANIAEETHGVNGGTGWGTGGGIVLGYGFYSLVNTMVNTNTAGTSDVHVVLPTDTTTTYGAFGGGILATDSTLDIQGGSVSNNRAVEVASGTHTAWGGGIASSDASVTLAGAAIDGNSASAAATDSTAYGGGIALGGTADISDTSISHDSVSGHDAYGGGLLIGEGIGSITGSTLVTDAATGAETAFGGGAAIEEAELPITGSTFANDTVTLTGSHGSALGGGLLAGGAASLDGDTFTANVAKSTHGTSDAEIGGGGAAFEEGFLSLSNSRFSGNQALDGIGAGLFLTDGDAVVSHDVFDGNAASRVGNSAFAGAGGAIGFFESELTVTSSTVVGNSALGGGAIFAVEVEGELRVIASTLADNTAEVGGGVFLEGGQLQLTTSAIVQNQTTHGTLPTEETGTGGGVFLGTDAALNLTHATVAGNRAVTSGAGVFALGGVGTVSTPDTATPGAAGGLWNSSVVSGNTSAAGENDCTFGAPLTTGTLAQPFTSVGGNVVGDTSCKLTAPSDRQGPGAQGYTLVGTTGGVYNFNTPFLGSLPGVGVHVNDVGGTADVPGGGGYWMFGQDGGVFSFGNAAFYGSVPGVGVHVNNIVAMAATPTGGGYWLVGADGGVYSFGNAQFYGSVPGAGVHVNNVVGMAATPDGRGYTVVGSTGGVYSFGDAGFYGSLPGVGVHVTNVVGMTSTATGQGYWMVGTTGGVYSFGTAKFFGSVPGVGVHVTNVTTLAAMPTAKGYWVFGDTGGVYSFGTAPFHGSVPGAGVHVTNVVAGFSI